MSKILAVQMESMKVYYEDSSSFSLMLEAQKRGYKVFHYEPHHMFYEDGEVYACMRPLELRYDSDDCYTWLDVRKKINLKHTDVILLRSEPPFDMGYITATYLLDMVKPHTRIINDPTAVRNFSEKLIMGYFSEYAPPTIVSSDIDALQGFMNTHGDIIVKPLYGCGGQGIVKIHHKDNNLESVAGLLMAHNNEPIMVQKWLPDIARGDKRIFLANGEVIFAFNRVPDVGAVRANLHAGGRIEQASLTPHEDTICATFKPFLQHHGIGLAGVDMIGDYVTEINITSPGGISQYCTAFGVDNTPAVMDALGL